MHDDEPPAPGAHAVAAAEAVRSLNHATLNDPLRYPAEAADIVGGLKAMAERLPQALQQSDRAVAGMHASGALYSYRSPERLPEDATEVRALFAAAEAQAHDLAGTLTRLHNLLGQFGLSER